MRPQTALSFHGKQMEKEMKKETGEKTERTTGSMQKPGTYGACRFCGQYFWVSEDTELSDAEADELATRKCDCLDAREYRAGIKRKADIEAAIRSEFGEKAGAYRLSPELQDAVIQIGYAAAAMSLQKCSVNIDGNVKFSISWKDGKVKINKSISNKMQVEV